MNRLSRWMVVGFLLAALGSSALAGEPGAVSPYLSDCCGGGGQAYWGWYGPWVYVRDYLPYYAVHPPVYYSYPVPRPYGWSPFAYPPGVRTPEILRPAEPLTVPNPFVPQKMQGNAPSQLTVAPKRIVNPYVVAGDARPTDGQLTRLAPQVVHPADLEANR